MSDSLEPGSEANDSHSQSAYNESDFEAQDHADLRHTFSDDQSTSNAEDSPQAEDSLSRQDRLKQLKRFYSDKYLELLNDSTSENILQNEPEVVLSTTQHGIVSWSPREREVLFQTLSRKGRHDIKSIAITIGSKSEIEVVAFLSLLQNRSADQYLYKDFARAIALAEIPAALEIGPQTESLLDKYAEALCLYQDNVDSLLGEQQHPNYWLIDREKAERLDQLVDSLDGPTDDPELPVPEAELLYLSKFIELSETIFMNAGEPKVDENWRNVAFDNETPALTLETVSEFYELVISITRRLVQTTLVLAQSRIRASMGKGYAPNPIVKELDVAAALDILNMPQNSWKFWYGAPRRCHLKMIYHQQPKLRKGDYHIDYDHLEKIMWEKAFNPRRGRSSSRSNESSASEHTSDEATSDREREPVSLEIQPGHHDIDGTDSTDEYVTEGSEEQIGLNGEAQSDVESEESEDDTSSSESQPDIDLINDEGTGRRDRNEADHHKFAEQQDLAASHEEEIRLWSHLGRKLPNNFPEAIPLPLGPRPPVFRKSRTELTDWAESARREYGWVDYCHGGDETDMEVPLPKRQKIEQGKQ